MSTFSASLRQPATRVGVEALAHALLKNRPRLKELDLCGVDDEEHVQRMVDEMVNTPLLGWYITVHGLRWPARAGLLYHLVYTQQCRAPHAHGHGGGEASLAGL